MATESEAGLISITSVATTPNSHDDSYRPSSIKPFTVFCTTCRTIVGDSTAFVCNVEALKAVILAHVKDVIVAEDARTADKGGEDEISIYRDLTCSHCKTIIGRRYLAIPKFPQIQENYTLFRDWTSLYHHGSIAPKYSSPGKVQVQKLVAPAHIQLAQDITSLKRFCLMLSDGQDSLNAQVKGLSGNSMHGLSEISNMREHDPIKMRLASLERTVQDLTEKQTRLVAEMRRESARVSSDYGIEVSRNHRSSNMSNGHAIQQNLSPPPSMPSQDASEEAESFYLARSSTNRTDGSMEKKLDMTSESVDIFTDDDDIGDGRHTSKRSKVAPKRTWSTRRSGRSSTTSIIPESTLNTPTPDVQETHFTPNGRVTRSARK